MEMTANATEAAFHRKRADMRRFGMWLFLGSEVMFFTGFFAAYIVIRSASAGSIVQPLNKALGTLNTVILITSSFTMALAVLASKKGDRKGLVNWMGLTWILGVVFLCVKGVEYAQHFSEGIYPSTDIFHAFYFLFTGFHALHVIAGLVVMGVLWFRARRGDFNETYNDPIEMMGLYWHFVDLVWIFLYPALYLL